MTTPATTAIDRTGVSLGLAAAALTLAAPDAGGAALGPSAVALVIVWIVWRDATAFIIPDGAALALALLGATIRVGANGATLDVGLSLLLDVALTGGALWALREAYYRVKGVDGIGLGDVKLAAAGGCLIGAEGLAIALLAASAAGVAVALARGVGRTGRLAFGALLAPAIFAVWAASGFAPAGWG